MTIELDKNKYITELEKSLKSFYDAKTIGDKEQIKYFQGYTKGMIAVMKNLGIVNEDELKSIVKEVELDIPTANSTIKCNFRKDA